MNTFITNPPQDPVRQAQEEIAGVKAIMVQNVEQILSRGERIELLVDKTDHMSTQAKAFRKRSQALRRKMWWRNTKFVAVSQYIRRLLTSCDLQTIGSFGFHNSREYTRELIETTEHQSKLLCTDPLVHPGTVCSSCQPNIGDPGPWLSGSETCSIACARSTTFYCLLNLSLPTRDGKANDRVLLYMACVLTGQKRPFTLPCTSTVFISTLSIGLPALLTVSPFIELSSSHLHSTVLTS